MNCLMYDYNNYISVHKNMSTYDYIVEQRDKENEKDQDEDVESIGSNRRAKRVSLQGHASISPLSAKYCLN